MTPNIVVKLTNKKSAKNSLDKDTKSAQPVTVVDIPVEINGSYETDLDLLQIDQWIKNSFEQQLEATKIKEDEIKAVKEKIENYNGDVFGFKRLKRCLSDIEKDKTVGSIKRSREEYIDKSSLIIEDYKPLSTTSNINISLKNKNICDSVLKDLKTAQRMKIIDRYLKVAEKFITINLTKKIAKSNGCAACGYDLTQLDDEICHCICGLELPVISKTCSYKETSKPIGANPPCEDFKNFNKAFLAIQGKQPSKDLISVQDLDRTLDGYFKSIGYETGEYYRQLENLPNGKKLGTNFQDMITALDKTGQPEHYTNAHLICKIYWKWKLMDLSEIHEKIIKDYYSTQEEWERINERESSPNVKIRLFLHIRACGIMCDRRDFKFPVTNDCLVYYNNILKKVFNNCGLKYTELI